VELMQVTARRVNRLTSRCRPTLPRASFVAWRLKRPTAARATVRPVHETLFSVPVRDLERSDRRCKWEIPPTWLDWALADSEARSDGTVGTLELYLKKQGREVLVKGNARAGVTMPCARTLEPVAVALDAEILLLLSPRATPAPSAARPGPGAPRRRQRGTTSGAGPAAGADPSESDDGSLEILSTEDAARDEYSGDNIELDAFVREHLLLELPLFPVRSDLPFEPNAATNTPPDDSGAAPDPRLAPLAALASELKKTGKLPKSS
jgi:uncharacterized protein